MNSDNSDAKDKGHSCHKSNHRPIKHILHMILCCSIPIIILLSLPLIAKINPSFALVLGVIAPFICPLMMGGMIFTMFKGNRADKKTDDKKEMMISEKESRKF